MDNGRVFFCRDDWRHFNLNGFNTVTLICANEIFGTFGCREGCNCESLFIIRFNNFTDLSQSVLTELGMR